MVNSMLNVAVQQYAEPQHRVFFGLLAELLVETSVDDVDEEEKDADGCEPVERDVTETLSTDV